MEVSFVVWVRENVNQYWQVYAVVENATEAEIAVKDAENHGLRAYYGVNVNHLWRA